MKQESRSARFILYPLCFLFLCFILIVTCTVYAVDTTIEGVTKKGTFACKSKEMISDFHAALRNMEEGKVNSYLKSGDCWKCEPDIKVAVVGNTDWGKPVEAVVDGKRFWMMQHMIQYPPDKEKENELAKLFYAAGVGIQCQWAPAKVMMFKIMRIGDYGIEQLKIDSDRVYELQKMHLHEGKEYARINGCDHFIVKMIKRDYEKYFTEQ